MPWVGEAPALDLTCVHPVCPPCRHQVTPSPTCVSSCRPSSLQAVIFCNTKRKVDWLTEKMRASNFTVSAMHGDMPQKVRGGSASVCHRSGGLVRRWVPVGATHTVCGRWHGGVWLYKPPWIFVAIAVLLIAMTQKSPCVLLNQTTTPHQPPHSL